MDFIRAFAAGEAHVMWKGTPYAHIMIPMEEVVEESGPEAPRRGPAPRGRRLLRVPRGGGGAGAPADRWEPVTLLRRPKPAW